MVEKQAQELINLQEEVSQIKSLIKEMEVKIEFLHKAIDNITKTNIEEIVALVAPSLGSKKEDDITKDSKIVEIAENCIKCDECIFKCGNEWEMVRHMSKEHEEILKICCSCDACGTYFGTSHLLKVHNKREHSIDVIAEVSSAKESEMDDHECQQCTFKRPLSINFMSTSKKTMTEKEQRKNRRIKRNK